MPATPDNGLPRMRAPIDKILTKRRAQRRNSRNKSREGERDAIMQMIFARYGYATVIAEKLGLKHQAVSQWNRVPPQYVVDLSRLLGLTPEQIRPDIFKPPRK